MSKQVTTGLAGDSATIILSGLEAGATVVLPSASTGTGSSGASPFGSSRKAGAGGLGGSLGGGGGFPAGGPRAAASRQAARDAPASPRRGADSSRPASRSARVANRRRDRRAPRRSTSRRSPRPTNWDRSRSEHCARCRCRSPAATSSRSWAAPERQEHPHEHPRLPRPADRRALPDRRHRRARHGRGRPLRPAQPQDRVRLPELQPCRTHERAGQRRTPTLLRRRRAPCAPPNAPFEHSPP